MSQIVKDYYNAHTKNEQSRLDLSMGRIEFLSTLRLIDKYLPQHGYICDIGGGTGRYTIEQLHKGYLVTLFDSSEAEIRLAGITLDQHKLIAEQLIVTCHATLYWTTGVLFTNIVTHPCLPTSYICVTLPVSGPAPLRTTPGRDRFM